MQFKNLQENRDVYVI